MYTLKSIVQRGSILGAAVVVAASAFPSVTFADALNPLTERSLLLSSSAPGFQNTDGSGNSADSPNAIGENYAPPGSGANGQKTGETFSFRVSTDSVATSKPVKAFTFQYCTTAAGLCQAPGNNGNMVPGYNPNDPTTAGDFRDGVFSEEVGAENLTGRPTNAQAHPNGFSDLEVVYADDGASAVAGTDFDVYLDLNDDGDFTDPGEDVSTGWTMATSNVEDNDHTGSLTGKHNFITLMHTTGITPEFNDQIRVVFNASATNYITNPGDDSFFVKINTYDSENPAHHIPTIAYDDNTHIIDGGVTVANVMTESIHITTKVLETMSFSVGTKNRDTKVIDCPIAPENPDCEGANSVHGTCDPIQTINNNRLNMGNPDAEYSLETNTAYDAHSYWRLSSNSSGGATVYYSGNTLANTVGDEIAEIGAGETLSTPGTEQFGLAFVDAADDTFDPVFSNGVDGLVETNPRYKLPTLLLASGTPDVYLQPESNYDEGEGNINDPDGTAGPEVIEAKFAFEKASNTVPRVIAENDSMVISCATAKMRYVANIGADTPAGVYTTKINYLAAPQY